MTTWSHESSWFSGQECLGLLLVKCCHECYGEKQLLKVILLVASLIPLQTAHTLRALIKLEPSESLCREICSL